MSGRCSTPSNETRHSRFSRACLRRHRQPTSRPAPPRTEGDATMIEATKISSTHLARCAFVYVRQSSSAQVDNNRESTERQYGLVDRAVALGWRRDHVRVV